MSYASHHKLFSDLVSRLAEIQPQAVPEWGIMTPHHMVEHVLVTWRISNGRARVKSPLPDEEIARRRAFLFSDLPYERGIRNPVQGDGLQPLRKPDMAAALVQLSDEVKTFFEYHQANPSAVEMHPVFGELDYIGWLRFQAKHMAHHAAQFGIAFPHLLAD